jgi:hypothetical protein
MTRPRKEAEARTVVVSAKISPTQATELAEVMTKRGITQADAVRAALDLLSDEVGVFRDTTGAVGETAKKSTTLIAESTEAVRIDPAPLPEVPEVSETVTSPKVIHRHKPAATPESTRYLAGTRLVTYACVTCGEVLPERRG